MGKIWDITPRAKPSRPAVKHSKRKRNNSSFFAFFLVLIAFVFIYMMLQNQPISSSSTNNPSVSTPQASPTDKMSIKVLNGTGKDEEAKKITQIVKNSGFTVNKTENALNLYEQTTVYFNSGYEQKAQKIAEELADYQAKTQAFSQESNYDIVVVVGNNL